MTNYYMSIYRTRKTYYRLIHKLLRCRAIDGILDPRSSPDSEWAGDGPLKQVKEIFSLSPRGCGGIGKCTDLCIGRRKAANHSFFNVVISAISPDPFDCIAVNHRLNSLIKSTRAFTYGINTTVDFFIMRF